MQIFDLMFAPIPLTIPHPSNSFFDVDTDTVITLKQHGFWAFIMTNIGILSLRAFAAAMLHTSCYHVAYQLLPCCIPVMQTMLNLFT